jgi:hypothetical protein
MAQQTKKHAKQKRIVRRVANFGARDSLEKMKKFSERKEKIVAYPPKARLKLLPDQRNARL